MQWYLKVLRQYADFATRAQRTEFWMFTLFNTLISIGLGIIDYLGGFKVGAIEEIPNSGFGVLQTIYGLAVLVPTLAVSVRRLHDIGRGGWWLLLGIGALLLYLVSAGAAFAGAGMGILVLAALIMIAVTILFVVWFCFDSQPQANHWGPNPKRYNRARMR